MATREWAVERSSGDLVCIADVVERYEALDQAQQQGFNKRDYKCQFCGVNYTASALPPSSKQPYFSVSTKESWKQVCASKYRACEVAMGSEARAVIRQGELLCSDADFSADAPVVNELVLLDDSQRTTTRGQRTPSGTSTPRARPRPSGKTSKLATVVHSLIAHQEVIAGQGLTVGGVDGSTYADVFQSLSYMAPNQRPNGTHIFFGWLNFKKPYTIQGKCLVFTLWTRSGDFKVRVYVDRWKEAHRKDLVRAAQRAYTHVNAKPGFDGSQRIYLFWLGEANPEYRRSMIINDYRKVHILGGEQIDFRGRGRGLFTDPPIVDHAEEAEVQPLVASLMEEAPIVSVANVDSVAASGSEGFSDTEDERDVPEDDVEAIEDGGRHKAETPRSNDFIGSSCENEAGGGRLAEPTEVYSVSKPVELAEDREEVAERNDGSSEATGWFKKVLTLMLGKA